MSQMGRVSLVGAGCGDYDLITVRGMQILGECDVVIYDALIDIRLLSFAKKAEKFSVGKRAGKYSSTQEEINSLIIKNAMKGKNVVRLKGGDPFVFGRGGEEAIALKQANIDFEIVPGISSAIAAAELAGIPVTHRDVSRSFEVITANTMRNDFPDDFSRLASSDGTLVFMMGLKKIMQIADNLILNGVNKATPSAVISNGATSRQKVVRAPLCDIARVVLEEELEPPAVFVVGKTAELELTTKLNKKLSGVSVCVTGSQNIVNRMSKLLENDGANVLSLPCLEIIKKADNPSLKAALQNIESFRCVAFTSTSGVEAFFEALVKECIDLRRLSNIKLAAVGKSTAKAIEKHGIFTDFIPDVATSKKLAQMLCERFDKSEKILIARAKNGSDDLTKILDNSNMCYEDIKVYETKALQLNPPLSCKYYIFASAAGVRAFFEMGGKVNDDSYAICIGKPTQNELEKRKVKNISISKSSSVESIENTIFLIERKNNNAQI